MDEKLRDDIPIFQQIAETIESGILEGSYSIGDRVPSTNEFAKFYQINPATAAKGINQLVEQEILFKKRGIGMFVGDNARNIILSKRKERFYHDYVVPLRTEAARLGISEDELNDWIRKGDRDEN
ncbi:MULTISPECIES: GntR family transcriptional regulator [Jeotgalibacillus]|uniref:GntR family transcriptional regulator n=1 Tax=Jeotgalibacillus TaxID=157226 RepID=UPI00106B15A3|nr:MULTISPECIES: GntR family transcriptional regulator [Jeotgalibacillus]TFD99963.1 GntR family transcriptional regulator [Jeotgalibacillus sp. R-1-5s-1]